jgi:hypothetical protein
MPHLENLRKQAKLILRWHRDRYYPVAAQIRSALPQTFKRQPWGARNFLVKNPDGNLLLFAGPAEEVE